MDLIICSNGDAVVDHMLFKVNNKINYKLKN